MAQKQRRGLPIPVAEAFLVCGEIWEDKHSDRIMLVAPTGQVRLPELPAAIRLSVYARLGSGHGHYQLGLSLRNEDDESTWDCQPHEKLAHGDPLVPHQVTFLNLDVIVQKPGKYRMVLLADGEDIAQQAIWISGPVHHE